MIAILEKYEHNVDFHQIVDFVEASHIRIETTDEGTKILATMDGKPRTISESSIRRNLKLNDEAGISSLPDAELFENLALMGYYYFAKSKVFFSESSNIATAVVCLVTNRVYNFSKMIFDGMVRNVNNKVSKFLMYPRVNSPSFSGRIVPLFDSMLVHQGEGSGTPTEPYHTPSLEAQQSSPTAPSSSSLPPATTETIPLVTSIAADEGSMQHKHYELTDLCTHLQRQQTKMASKIAAQDLKITSLMARIKLLEDKDGGGAEPSGEDATIKGRSLEIEEEAGVEKSTEREVAAVSVPTGSGMVPTASLIFTTASVVTPYSRHKGKEKMVESNTPKKKKLQEQIDVHVAREIEQQLAREDQRRNEQIARDAEIARIHAEEELENIELINELVKYQDHHSKILKYQAQQSKPLSKKQQREFYMSVLKSHSEERERFKRKRLRLEQDSAKKMKTSEEVSEEDLKEMRPEDLYGPIILMITVTGANNDINVLDNSPLFDDLLDDLAPAVPYVVNGVEYRNGYYLVDGIYAEWASFVKSFMVATDPKHTYFKQRQESARKMSNVLSVFSKDVGDLFNNWPVHTKSTHYVESWLTFCQEDAWAILKFHPKWDAPEQVDLTGDVPGATQEDLFGHDARPRPNGKPRPTKKTKSDATASTGGNYAFEIQQVHKALKTQNLTSPQVSDFTTPN
nr:hypothetical protein [Tanacetum cinerariifolium]